MKKKKATPKSDYFAAAINCRISPMLKRMVAIRAREMNVRESDYLRDLIRDDLKRAGIIK